MDQQAMSMETMLAYKENLESRLPGVTVVVLAARQLAVYRPDSDGVAAARAGTSHP